MQEEKILSVTKRGFWTLVGVTIFFLVFIIQKAIRVGVDPYHEGALFPSAVGVAHGLHIFSEVNNQYGFIYALIQAPLLYLVGNYLLITRIVGTAVFCVTIYFTYLIIRKVWGKQTSLFVVIVCLAINPSWSYISFQALTRFDAWINIYGVMLVIISTFITLRELGKANQSTYPYFIAGMIILSSTFVRPEFFLVWAFQFLFLLHCRRRSVLSRSNLNSWALGSLFTGALAAAYLIWIGSLADYFKQLVLVWFSAPPNSAHLGLGNLFTFGVSCLLFISYFLMVNFLSRFQFKWVLISLFSAIAIFLLNRKVGNLGTTTVLGKIIGPYLQTAVDGFLLNYSSILVLTLILVTLFHSWSNRKSLRITTTLLQVTSLGLLAQLHNINSAYIFMFNPIIVAWFMYWLKDQEIKYSRTFLGLRNTFIALVSTSLVIGLSLASQPTYNFRTTVLKGLSDHSPNTRDLIDSKFEMLSDFVGIGTLYFDCPYGLFATSENGLYVADKWTWNEIPNEWLQQSIEKANSGEFLLRCGDGLKGVIEYDDFVETDKIELVKRIDDFVLYRFE